ncbi:hypothetical protein EB796_005967 [Bugula neritina]|uniref:Uncharacterized protein n=1 Tax=Bugula neritina TaxID=10212 RepID=A0A7J7KCZ6_BUGNE|nr:hypothetical protein EB796_005967 [Bugula neritina]
MSFRYDIIPPKVLDAVQMSHIFPDSKTFVDKPLRATTDELSQAFNALPQPLSTKHLKEFVEKYLMKKATTWSPSYRPTSMRVPNSWRQLRTTDSRSLHLV